MQKRGIKHPISQVRQGPQARAPSSKGKKNPKRSDDKVCTPVRTPEYVQIRQKRKIGNHPSHSIAGFCSTHLADAHGDKRGLHFGKYPVPFRDAFRDTIPVTIVDAKTPCPQGCAGAMPTVVLTLMPVPVEVE